MHVGHAPRAGPGTNAPNPEEPTPSQTPFADGHPGAARQRTDERAESAFAARPHRARTFAMADVADTAHADSEESEAERLDRELHQLLGALRVAMPGATLLASAAASARFVAPTANHRLMLRERDKPRLLSISTKLALLGLVCLAFAMYGAVLLVTDVLFGRTPAVVTVAATATLFVGLWFGVGLVRKIAKQRGDE